MVTASPEHPQIIRSWKSGAAHRVPVHGQLARRRARAAPCGCRGTLASDSVRLALFCSHLSMLPGVPGQLPHLQPLSEPRPWVLWLFGCPRLPGLWGWGWAPGVGLGVGQMDAGPPPAADDDPPAAPGQVEVLLLELLEAVGNDRFRVELSPAPCWHFHHPTGT